MNNKKIKSALISVYHKHGLDEIIRLLKKNGVNLISTGGTFDFIQKLGIEATEVSSLTQFPEILGGRVKTLHPAIFSGILARRENAEDLKTLEAQGISEIDLVIVDLYPFSETVSSGADENTIIEKIDIGGVSLIRAAAKNFKDTVVVGSSNEYDMLLEILKSRGNETSIEERRTFADRAFNVTSGYDRSIANYFGGISTTPLRYGENPHQKGFFTGNLNQFVDQLGGKELSYNNLADLDASLQLLNEFEEPACVIIKHCNPCGVAIGGDLLGVWKRALASDPLSAFGGVIALNGEVDQRLAVEINELFFEVLCAPGFTAEALEILGQKKNRILLKLKQMPSFSRNLKSVMDGRLHQSVDNHLSNPSDWKCVSDRPVSPEMIADMKLAEIVSKHAKSNAIAIVKNGQLLGLGCGLTSRVDACRHAISKAAEFGHNLKGSTLGSDAFFPFTDTLEIAHQAGVTQFVQPGGSVKDQLSIDYCNANNLVMIFTGLRHFKH